MKKLFDELSQQVSKETTQKYSTSFSLGIKALHKSIQPSIYAIYGYVRLADEIVDSFHEHNKNILLKRLIEQTYEALDERISLNPILQSFQTSVHAYNIDRNLIDQFLHSMEMDLQPIKYNPDLYKEYIVGSAEVVGLMCLKVFTEGNEDAYEKLKPYAMKLGSAFQKVNFLRDIKDDYQVLGRTYFPNININNFNNLVKVDIEQEIEDEFKEALIGIKMLPSASRFAVYLAYQYYFSLFLKIKKQAAQNLLKKRIRISNSKKMSLALTSFMRYKLYLL